MMFFLSLGKLKEFLLTVLFVTIHEAMHIIAARLLGAKLSEILITPIGERAIIRDMDLLPPEKRLLILILGPLVNLAIGLVFKVFLPVEGVYTFIAEMNIAIGIFNLIPVFPLDGGRIILLLFENKFGTLRSAEMIIKLGKCFSFFCLAIGIVQLILYPFNISLMVMGLYLLECNKKEYLNISSAFLMSLLKMKKGTKEKPVLLKEILVSGNMKLSRVIRLFSADRYCMVYFFKNGELMRRTQTEIIEIVMEKGLCQSVEG